MRLDMSQQMGMLQQMKLAPRMIQSMEILQLPIMALEERIRQEEEQNVTLEVGASTTETPATDLEANAGNGETPSTTDERDTGDGPTDQERDAIEQMIAEYDDNFLPSHGPSRAAGVELSNRKHEAIQNMADRPPSLEAHLLQQMTLAEEEPIVLAFAEYLVQNLDRSGFLNGPLEEIRATFDHPLTDDETERALSVIQELEPTGVGARDLRECLLLQLRDPDDEVEHVEVQRTLVANHLEDLEHNRLPAIERKTGYSLDLLHEAIEQLRNLDLNPASEFVSGSTQYVVPDVTVEPGSDGEFDIKMNEENTPNVFINRQYIDMLRERRDNPEAVEWVKKKIAAARWLIDSIEQRRNTLERVTRAIIDHQRDFLERGPDHIEPLKMQQIADRVGVHVTTVSRAVDGKWVQTPRGIFPLKRFFGGGTVTTSGEEVAWDTIKRKLTEIVDAEDKSNPCSDDELVNRLRAVGYPLARRTVTKYRKMLDIPSSRQRKVHR